MRTARSGASTKRLKRVEFSHDTDVVKSAESRLTKALASKLKAIGKHMASKLSHLAKPTQMSGGGDKKDIDDAIDDADWESIASAVAAETAKVAADGAKNALVTLGVSDDESITNQTFTKAVEAAKARAAELVGRRWDEDGELVDNPDAEWAITDSLRDDIREAVAKAIEDGDSAADLADTIEGLGSFSEDRAMMISRTELISAHSQGQLRALKESGVVEKKGWSTSNEDSVCDICEANEDEGPISLDDDFPSGDDAPPGHPLCMCVLTAAFDEADEDEESEDADSDDDEDEAAE